MDPQTSIRTTGVVLIEVCGCRKCKKCRKCIGLLMYVAYTSYTIYISSIMASYCTLFLILTVPLVASVLVRKISWRVFPS